MKKQNKPENEKKTLIKFEYFKVTFYFNIEKVSFNGMPYQTLKQLKDKATKHFFACPKNVRSYYQNKDVTEKETEQLGIAFQGKKNIEIKLVDEQSSSKIKQKKEEIKSSLSEYQYKKILKEAKQNSNNNDKLICECKSEDVTSYCRNCKAFICSNCKSNDKHKKHQKIIIDKTNLEVSLQTFIGIIQNELDAKLKISETFKNNFEKGQKKNELISTNDKIIKKLGEINQNYSEILQIVEERKKNKSLNKVEVDGFFIDYNSNCETIKNEMNEILQEAKETLGEEAKAGVVDFDYYFSKIGETVKKYNTGTGKDFAFLNLYFELMFKMQRMYDKINSAISQFSESGIFDKVKAETKNKK